MNLFGLYEQEKMLLLKTRKKFVREFEQKSKMHGSQLVNRFVSNMGDQLRVLMHQI